MKFEELITLPEAPTGTAGWPWNAASRSTNIHDNKLWPRVTIVTPSYNQEHLDNYWNCLSSDEDIIVFNQSSVLTA